MELRDLSAHEPYVAGRGAEAVASERGLDTEELLTLASNENQPGPSPAAIEAIRTAASRANRYPKASHVDLQAALAERWDLRPAQVWLANGGDGALDYLARATLEPGDRVLVPDPGFAYYGMSARFHHGVVSTYPLERAEDFALTAETVLDAFEDERVVYLTTPHSPTGSEIGLEGLRSVANETGPETLVVVDEAYGEFTDSPSARQLLEDRDDVAVLRTFSKAYGLAGVRLGYALVPSAWAEAYERVNTPFAASEIACRAGLAALEDDAHLTESVETARWARRYLRDELDLPSWPSGGNFVLVDVSRFRDAARSNDDRESTATSVTDRLADREVLVRDCTSFGLPECVRITCGTEAETKRAVSTVNATVEERLTAGGDAR